MHLPPFRIAKELSLIEGQNAVYGTDTITGFAGPAPLGHHATLAMPDKEGAVRIATSPIRFGMTNPTQFSDPTKGEYQSFAIGARFTDLAQVPLQFKGAPDADVFDPLHPGSRQSTSRIRAGEDAGVCSRSGDVCFDDRPARERAGEA